MTRRTGRRQVLQGMTAATALLLLPKSLASLQGALEAAYQERFGDRRPEPDGVRIDLDISTLVENGNSVAVTVRARPDGEPPRSLHLFMPRNPEPWGGSVEVAPPALAEFSTRIRLAGSQDVVAVAEWADGRLGAKAVSVLVTLGACADELYGGQW